MAGEIYRKIDGAWVKQIDIDDGADGDPGAEWHSAAGAPSGSLGRVGDFYFRTSNGYVYEKTGESTWTFRQDITGPQGTPGRDGTTTTITKIQNLAGRYVQEIRILQPRIADPNVCTGIESVARTWSVTNSGTNGLSGTLTFTTTYGSKGGRNC